MPSDLLARYPHHVPEVDDDNPIAWCTYLQQHGATGRRIARAVLELYDGNVAKLARMLDVSPGVIAKHVKHPTMRWMLQERKPITTPEHAIADREERAELLTALMREERVDVKDRLKALELLGKMEGDYLERVEVKGQITTLHELVQSLAEPPAKPGVEYVPHTTKLPAPAEKPDELEELLR